MYWTIINHPLEPAKIEAGGPFQKLNEAEASAQRVRVTGLYANVVMPVTLESTIRIANQARTAASIEMELAQLKEEIADLRTQLSDVREERDQAEQSLKEAR